MYAVVLAASKVAEELLQQTPPDTHVDETFSYTEACLIALSSTTTAGTQINAWETELQP